MSDVAAARADLDEIRRWIIGLAAQVRPAGLVAACLHGRGEIQLHDTLVLNASYPADWMSWYLATRADRIDPVLRQACDTGLSFVWDSAIIADAPGITEEFMSLAAAHRLEAGAIAVHPDFDGRLSLLAVAGPAGLPYAEQLPRLTLAVQHAHPRLCKLADAQRRALPFTEMEMALLHSLQLGLDDSTLAAWHNISPTTVRTHFASLMRRTGLCRTKALALLRQWQPPILGSRPRRPSATPPLQFHLFSARKKAGRPRRTARTTPLAHR